MTDFKARAVCQRCVLLPPMRMRAAMLRAASNPV
jgi:hypothetical protein